MLIGAGLCMIHPWNITNNSNAIVGDDVMVFNDCNMSAIVNGSKKQNLA